ncbi:MAG: zinc-dependent metalloprotease [Luteitalea sp.]
MFLIRSAIALVLLGLTCLCLVTEASAQGQLPKIGERTRQWTRMDGFVPLYWDEQSGRIYLEISRLDQELLYQTSLPAGVGSNPIGLDRGQLGSTAVVTFQRVGPKVLLTQVNYRFRALSADPAERQAVADSFARSVLWGFKVEAADEGRVLVDATDFVLRDAHGVTSRLRSTNQGSYRVDASRTAVHLARTKAFPRNSEIEATVTLVTDGAPGALVSQVTPTPEAITVRQHHSFVQLPDLATHPFTPRDADPRAGGIDLTFHDYASAITEPIEKHWAIRHLLQKRTPAAAASDVVEPIVYYVDNGTPEPIRTALLEGAQWWAAAFEAAGFRNGFQVKVLPADADPMDLRYNMINWVHRSTRGWSYGAAVVDPRTGQILKGNVSLGSLRVRQDIMLGSGLTALASGSDPRLECAAGDSPDAEYLADLDPTTDATAMALARIRQLSAHEVGHTLGLTHNFAASTYGRASVMDYPAPMVKITAGKIDLSEAYGVGIGPFDTFAVRYAYSQFVPGADDRVELARMVDEATAKGLLFIADSDARPAGAAHPLASLWDNGTDPVANLTHELAVRQLAMSTFDITRIRDGQSLSFLEQKFLPLYFHHRYQLQAAVKSVGGQSYTYAVRKGDAPSPAPAAIVAPEVQRAALSAVLDTLSPEVLVVPARILALLQPPTEIFGGVNTEMFPRRTGLTFDPVAAATIAADMAIGGLLNPERAARLVEFHARDASNPGLHDVVNALAERLRASTRTESPAALALRAAQAVFARRLMDLAADENASSDVRGIAAQFITQVPSLLTVPGQGVRTPDWAAHHAALEAEATRFLARPAAPYTPQKPLPVPAGDPIGQP